VELTPEALWAEVRARSAAAHASGDLHRIVSEPLFIEDGGVEFVVRRAIDFAGQRARLPRARPGNPFDPPEEPLFVGHVSPTHYALLNKYHVIENHLLVVTRRFVDQEALLDLSDFEALVACLPGDGCAVAFYNGGTVAGASQPHKHLQVVTLPLSPRAPIPMAARMSGEAPDLPFPNAFARIASREPLRLLDCYRNLLDRAGIHAIARDGVERQSAAYNMLLAEDWMLVVPRAHERFAGIAVNSIGFLGALFTRDEREFAAVRETGPMTVLEKVAGSSRA